jgi:hypothetical protein
MRIFGSSEREALKAVSKKKKKPVKFEDDNE